MEKEDKEQQIDYNEICIFGKDNNEIKIELNESNHMFITCKELMNKIDENLNLFKDANLSIHDVFSLSLISNYLELPLKSNYKPFGILACWSELVETFAPKYHQLKRDKIEEDQPVLCLQRNIFLNKSDEEKIDNEIVLKLLYEEAKSNILDGKYQIEGEEYLSAIQLKIDYLRTNDDRILTTQYFKENVDQYLSLNYLQSKSGPFLTLNRLKAAARNLDQKVNLILNSNELNLPLKDLYKEYLKKCHQLTYYGSVFFHGQMEKNLSMFSSLIRAQDLKVWVGINFEGIHFIDKKTSELLITFVYDDFLWELAVPQSINENQNALPCLFIETNEDSEKKIMQIFSRQAKLMDNTLKEFDDKIRSNCSQDVVDSSFYNRSISQSSTKSFKKNLSFCSFAIIDQKGRCVKKTGSLKFVKKIAN